jgi:hypothetical protein
LICRDAEGWHLQDIKCSTCGHEPATDAACPGCGDTPGNGTSGSARVKPPPPPEVANWVMTPTPPEMLKLLRETFDEAEFIAALREVERTGGTRIDDLIDEIERKINGSV